MNSLYQYVLRVICTVMLCGTVRFLFCGEENLTIKMLTGLIMTVVVLTPLLGGEIPLRSFMNEISIDGEAAVENGTLAARMATNEFIKEKTEAYILNKASELGANIGVDIVLSDDEIRVPTQITVSGTLSPYTKKKLSACIYNELGIPEDEQIWIS